MRRDTSIVPGLRFGRLIVVRELEARRYAASTVRVFLCRCDCGNEKQITANGLRERKTKSCGCLTAEVTRARSITHGHTRGGKSRTYRVWVDMWKRCRNRNSSAWSNYGGRGIAVCERWRSFEMFLLDMGEAPEGHELDRVDVNGVYEPINCRWATLEQQANNKRNNRRIEHDGRTLTFAQWDRAMGYPPNTVGKRIRRGWPPSRAIIEPLREWPLPRHKEARTGKRA